MKWPADISLFVNDDGPPVDIWHNGVCGGPMLAAHSMDAAQAIVGAIEELHGLRAEVGTLKRDLSNAEHAVIVWKSAEHSASSIARNLGSIADNKQREIEMLAEQVRDLQLALAAERLDPTAGTDLDYHLIDSVYIRRVEGGHIEVEMRDEPKGRWRAYRFARGLVVPPWREVWADNARTAMREANEKEKP